MHTINLTDEQISIVGAALAELPFKVAAPVINLIQAQLNAQAKPETEDGEKGEVNDAA